MAPIVFDEDEAKLLLVNGDTDLEEGFKRIFYKFKDDLFVFIKKRIPALKPERIINAISKTFEELLIIVREGKFDIDRPLWPYLKVLTYNNATDQRRKQSGRDDYEFNESLSDEIADKLKNTKTGDLWNEISSKNVADKIEREFREFVLILKPWQKEVAQIIADFFPDYLEYKEICQEVYKRTQKLPTTTNVKSAVEQIRKKFKDILKKEGISYE